MKVFIVFASLLAITLAGHYPHAYYPLHIPVIGHNGVPLESPEIIHARQAHLSHVAAVKSRQGAYGYGGYGYAGGYGGHEGYGYGGYAHAYPLIGHNGVPIDTPEVQAAKAAHFAAYNKAAAAAASYGGGYEHGHYRRRRGIYGLGANGVPIETPEVQAAKAAHFAAHAKLGGGYGGYANGIGGGYGGAYHYGGYSHAPLDHDGRVRDTPEVEALKAKHFEAYNAALSRVSSYGHGGAIAGGYGGGYEGGYQKAGLYNAGNAGYHGPQHIPVIGPHGVPLDTPEVAAARQYHLKALADASSKSYEHGYHL